MEGKKNGFLNMSDKYTAVELKERCSISHSVDMLKKGSQIVWVGDYYHGKAFLAEIGKALDKSKLGSGASTASGAYLADRTWNARRNSILNRFVLPRTTVYRLQNKRAPDVVAACMHALGESYTGDNIPFRKLLGIMGAYQWHIRGTFIPAIESTIRPNYGVFSPAIRNEYLNLLNSLAIHEDVELAYDIGTGTGVLSVILLKKGVRHVIATDISSRAISCARENLSSCGLIDRVSLVQCDVFPPEANDSNLKPDLIICNPPWIPLPPGDSELDLAIFDAGGDMLKKFIGGLSANLSDAAHAEAILILSDLAVHLGLRSQSHITELINNANLFVYDKLDAKPSNLSARTCSASSPTSTSAVAHARSREVTSLFRIRKRR